MPAPTHVLLPTATLDRVRDILHAAAAHEGVTPRVSGDLMEAQRMLEADALSVDDYEAPPLTVVEGIQLATRNARPVDIDSVVTAEGRPEEHTYLDLDLRGLVDDAGPRA